MLSSFDPDASLFAADSLSANSLSSRAHNSNINLISTSASPSTLKPADNIAFVDAGLADIETLIAGLEDTQVVLLDTAQNGISQITATLANHQNLSSVHIFSHGTDGLLQLGDTLLNNANVETYGESLQQWASALSAEADLMIYGCNLAAGAEGLALVHRLGELTGADVAASDDITGAEGDWQLETTTGDIETGIALSLPAQTRYAGKLAADVELLKNRGFESNLNGWDRFYSGESVVTSGAYAGSKALKLTKDRGGAQQVIDVVAGQTYKVSGYGKKTGPAYIGFGMTFYDAADQRIAGGLVNNAITSSNWQLYEGEAVAPDNASSLHFWTYHDWGEGTGFIDQLSLTTNVIEGEPSLVSLDDSTLTADESDRTVRVVVNREGGTEGELTVDYRTLSGSATAGEDYEAVSGTLTFADGQARRAVNINLLDDDTPEGRESFSFAIDNVGGNGTLGAPRTAGIEITDDDTFSYNGNQYVTTNSIKTWEQAQAEAKRLGGNLVTINTAEEETWLKQTFGGTEGFWIGLNDVETEGSFEWASGESLAYTNWAPGEPNDGGPNRSQDYGWMNFSSTRQWDDHFNDAKLRGIIEIGDYNGPLDGQGNGLKGRYYNNSDFTDLKETRTDATVNFNWGSGSPDPSIENDTFSVRWNGRIEPRYSERYTFQTNSNDGVRLWVNDRLIIDKFNNQAATTNTGQITLEAGQQYDIRMEYYEDTGNAFSRLSWSSASQALEIVPRSQLYSDPVDDRTLSSEVVLRGLSAPTAVDWLTDGSERMLVAQQGGVVELYENGKLNGQPFIDISRQVNGIRDRGLLDIAVHPDFENNPYVYLLFTYDPPEVFDYTGDSGPDGKNNRAARLIRVTADAANNYRTAVEDSEVVLLGTNSTWDNYNGLINSTFDIDAPSGGIAEDGSYIRDFLAADSESHTIGSVEFGADGALYVSNGDGASYNRVDPRAVRVQDLDSLSGKILRIDPITGKGLSSNPFYNNDPNANRSKVYQLGLRNPFRMTIDQGNGNIYIGDVGWSTWEEINAGEAGANFGWPYYEGETGVNERNNRYGTLPDADEFYNSDDFITPSILSLNHRDDGINAIIMGDVYTGDAYPERYKGDLFFGDLGQGIIRNVSFDSDGEVSSVETFGVEDSYVVQMAQGPDDLMYYVNQRNGTVRRWTFEEA